MSTRKMIKGAYATKIAQKTLPVIDQVIGFSRNNDDWKYDIPCGINFGDFILPRRPLIYYWIRQDKQYYYVGYAFYHWFDYTHCLAGKPFGEHKDDMEGVIIRLPRFNPDGHAPDHKKRRIVTICHHNILKSNNFYNRIWVEFGGHGIHPGPYTGDRDCLIMRKVCSLENMDGWSKRRWKEVEEKYAEGDAKTPKGWGIGGYNFWEHPEIFFNAPEILKQLKKG